MRSLRKMTSRKGFNMLMGAIIVLVVLIIVAGVSLMIFGQTTDNIEDFKNAQNIQTCIDARNAFCNKQATVCWNSKEQFFTGNTCFTILRNTEGGSNNDEGNFQDNGDGAFYNCEAVHWYETQDACRAAEGSASAGEKSETA